MDVFELELLGSFRLTAPDGTRIRVPAERSRVLLAMLATSPRGGRSRRWLQAHLWGSRDWHDPQASMRRELSNLRRIVNTDEHMLLIVDREAIALNLDKVVVDVRDPDLVAATREDFLEGIDFAGEERFEDWLRDERQSINAVREAGGRRLAGKVVRYGASASAIGAGL